MVARINTIAFQGVDVQSIDVQVQISNGLPAFTIVGYILLVLLSLMPVSANASETCPLYGAEYVPQGQEKQIKKAYDKNVNAINPTLSFILTIEKGDLGGATRSTFLNFNAYNQNNEKVSTMRLGDTWSNGIARQSFSTYFGMYCKFGRSDKSDCKEMKPYAGFIPIGVNKDLSQSHITETPYLLIFPETQTVLRYNSYQAPEHWDKYIKFYTEDRIYPDFRGYDFWVRKKCGPVIEGKE